MSISNKINNFIFRVLNKLSITRYLSDEFYIKNQYELRLGKKLNLQNPQTFNEKLQWLKLYDQNPLYTKLVDKYAVRKYIAGKIGEEHLIPLLAHYHHFDEINFNELPNQFVLKCTHDSGGVVICKDKSTFNLAEARRKINNSLNRNYYYDGREWPYKNVEPKIICEKYIEESGQPPKDYKFFCFNGQPKIIQVDLDRFKGHKRNMYDSKWNLLDFNLMYETSSAKIEKPLQLNNMIEIVSKLSKEIPFVRVDLYQVENKIFFGELTFYPENGTGRFTPESYDDLLGSWIKLPLKKNNN